MQPAQRAVCPTCCHPAATRMRLREGRSLLRSGLHSRWPMGGQVGGVGKRVSVHGSCVPPPIPHSTYSRQSAVRLHIQAAHGVPSPCLASFTRSVCLQGTLHLVLSLDRRVAGYSGAAHLRHSAPPPDVAGPGQWR